MWQEGRNEDKAGAGLPTYQLGFAGTESFSIDGSTSTEIVASNLPIKLESPFYQVYTDIVPTNYISEAQNLNCIGIVNKMYVASDFIYGQGSEYTEPVMFPSKVSSITTEIRLPDGRVAPIDALSTVIYKVERDIQIGLDEPEKEGKPLKKKVKKINLPLIKKKTMAV